MDKANRPFRIGISGSYGGMNLGDEAILDGLAPAPYIRESRRIRAELTVLEQHIAYPLRPDGPATFEDSVGIGCYRTPRHRLCRRNDRATTNGGA